MSSLLDASVLVPLFARDALTPRALALVGQLPAPLTVSDWATLETASAFGVKHRAGHLTLNEARAAIGNLDQWRQDFAIAATLASDDIQAALRLVSSFSLTLRAPDALHLALAQRLGATLATFDGKLAATARLVGVAVAP